MLAAAGSTLAAVAGAGAVSAQETEQAPGNETATATPEGGGEPEDVAQDEAAEFRALIIPPEAWDRSLEGFFVHAGGEVDPVSAAGSDECEYADWPNQESRAYDVTLIEREELLEDTARTTLYVRNDVDVPAGALFVIEEVHECPETSYRGVYIRQLGVRNLPNGGAPTDDEVDIGATNGTNEVGEANETGTPGADGPGFGAIGTLLGLGGAAGLAGLHSGRRGD